jgi:hypothetical protein
LQATAAAVQAVDHCCGALQCLKYKTDQQVDVKKMEKLNSLFFVLMARGEHPTGACVSSQQQLHQQHLHQKIEACSLAVDRFTAPCSVCFQLSASLGAL